MYSTLVRRATDSLGRSIQQIFPQNTLPSALVNKRGNLYQVLSRWPDGGVGREVHQVRWTIKSRWDCYWVVTRTKFKCEGKHGKAWGKYYYKGKLITPPGKDEEIRGGLKYSWQEGRSSVFRSKKSAASPTSTVKS